MAEEDLIFGKNRHLYGGIEPSNMINFSTTMENGRVRIDAELPNNTIINNQTICVVAGAVIRRRIDHYPKDEFDGDLIADIKVSSVLIDDNVQVNGTYYYAAYPYSTLGVYNRNKNNRNAINEPSDMTIFSAKLVYDKSINTPSIEITVDLPENANGAIIKKSEFGYPIDENDGDLVYDVTTDGVYTDTDVILGGTYYYSAFPYNNLGAYNRNEVNRINISVSNNVPKYTYLYGYDLDTTDSNPDTRISYPSDVDNASFTPVKMNFNTNLFEYGNWPSTPGEKFMPRPCMLNYNGVVDCYLNPNDYTKDVDGNNSKNNSAYDHNAMMEWPKIYTKRWEENGIYHFRCCDVKLDGDYECWCNYDKNNNEIDHFYTSIYECGVYNSRLRSITGLSIRTNITPPSFVTEAKANGDDWHISIFSDIMLINDLLVMMAKTTDCQSAYGSGRCQSSTATFISAGTMNSKGLFWGNTDGQNGVKVFGIENLWGNTYNCVAGYIVVDGSPYLKITRGTKDGSTASDYNFTSSGFLHINDATISGTNGGFISECKCTPYGRIPITSNGSRTTYEPDTLYFNLSGVFVPFIGGDCTSNAEAGPFYTKLIYKQTDSNAACGTMLSCKPSITT